jgi:hypothetical protein
MSQKYQYTTIDTILSKYLRDFKGLPFDEGDLIEWIGEALGFMKVPNVSEEDVVFLEVRNHIVEIPTGLHYIIQIARNNDWDGVTPVTEKSTEEAPEMTSSLQGYNSYYAWYNSLILSRKFSPVRLANHSFFNTLVCRLTVAEGLYLENRDEYGIVGNQIRFSFKSGIVAIAYLRTKIDKCTGYPMIPDHESAKAAITYYLAWKVKECEGFNHREGAMQLAAAAEERWLKYIKQFNNYNKMPTTVDELEDLRKQSSYLLPRSQPFYGFFGNTIGLTSRSR